VLGLIACQFALVHGVLSSVRIVVSSSQYGPKLQHPTRAG
jgi:hypothetical protein